MARRHPPTAPRPGTLRPRRSTAGIRCPIDYGSSTPYPSTHSASPTRRSVSYHSRRRPRGGVAYPAPNRCLVRQEPRGRHRHRPPDALRIFMLPRRSTRRHVRPVRSIHHYRPWDLGGRRRGSAAQHRSAVAGAKAAEIGAHGASDDLSRGLVLVAAAIVSPGALVGALCEPCPGASRAVPRGRHLSTQ